MGPRHSVDISSNGSTRENESHSVYNKLDDFEFECANISEDNRVENLSEGFKSIDNINAGRNNSKINLNSTSEVDFKLSQTNYEHYEKSHIANFRKDKLKNMRQFLKKLTFHNRELRNLIRDARQNMLDLYNEEISAVNRMADLEPLHITDCDFNLAGESGIIDILIEETCGEIINKKKLIRKKLRQAEQRNKKLTDSTSLSELSDFEENDSIMFMSHLLEKIYTAKSNLKKSKKFCSRSYEDGQNCIPGKRKCRNAYDEITSDSEETLGCHSNDEVNLDSSLRERKHNEYIDEFGKIYSDSQNSMSSNESLFESSNFESTENDEFNSTESGYRNKNPIHKENFGLRRNRMSLHLCGTSKLHEELKNNQPSNNCFKSPFAHCDQRTEIKYTFCVPADDLLHRCFNNKLDRRIESICRQSKCRIRLLSEVGINTNGLRTNRILIDSPSTEALKKCCYMIDEKFPDFNACVGLQSLKYTANVAGAEDSYKNVINLPVRVM